MGTSILTAPSRVRSLMMMWSPPHRLLLNLKQEPHLTTIVVRFTSKVRMADPPALLNLL